MRSIFGSLLAATLLTTLGLLVAMEPVLAQGLFARAQDFPAETQPESLATADFDGDGVVDLAVTNFDANQNLNVSILIGNGDGTFQDPANYELPPDQFQTPTAITTGDLNGDEAPDVVVANTGNRSEVVVFLNAGDGTLGEPVSYDPALGQSYPLAVTTGDFNRDGKADLGVGYLLAFNGGGNIAVFTGNGDGTFQDPVEFDSGTQELTSLTTADFDGDGNPDLATTSQGTGDQGPSDASVLLGNGDGTFRDATVYPVGTSPQLAVAHDLDGDGKADLATANQGANSVSVLLANGDGTFRSAVDYDAGTGTEPFAITAGDFDGDGKPDLATANPGTDGVSVLPGNGDGTFQAPEAYAAGSGTAFVVAPDLNADEKPDLATANANSNDVSILLNVAPPRVSSVDPASGFRGNTVTLTVNGSAFGSGAKVRLNQGDLSLGASSVTRDSATRLTAEISIPGFVPTGDYDVEVINPDRRDGVLAQAFQVSAPLSTRIALTASPRQLERGDSTRLIGKLTASGGQALSGEEVILERRPAGTRQRFRELETLTTGPEGGFRLSGLEPSRSTVYRARFLGDSAEGLEPSRALTRVRVRS